MKSSKRELRIALSSHRLRTVKGKGTMKEDREQTKLDFLEYAVTHLENRIGLLDKIASILIGRIQLPSATESNPVLLSG
jgi:hypothetical protein